MNPPAGPSAQEIVDAVLAVPEYGVRLRQIRLLRDRFDPALVDAFRRRAEVARRRDPREAERSAHLGLVVAEAIRDRRGRLACLVARAKAALLCSDSALALDSIEDAARLARDLDDEPMRAEVELLRVQALIPLERYAEARTSAARALDVFERRDDRRGRVLGLMALADLAFRMDRPREALREHNAAERLILPDDPVRIRAVLALNRANALVARNRFRAASRHFQRARDLFRTAGSDHSAASVDYNAAYGELLRGNYHEALRLLAACEPVFRRVDDQRSLAHVDLDRAEIHLHLHLPDDAAHLATAAEVRFLTLGLVKERAQAGYVYAQASDLRGDANTAASWFERAERLFRELGLAERVVVCMTSRAEVLEREGDAAAARSLAEEARSLVRAEMNPLSGARVDVLLARLDLAAGRFEPALVHAQAALRACRRVHAPWLRIDAARVVGQVRAAGHEIEPAMAAYECAVDQLDRSRVGIPDGEALKAFLGAHGRLYLEVAGILAEASRTPACHDDLAEDRSRALVDLVAGRRAGGAAGDRGVTAARLLRLRERLNSVYRRDDSVPGGIR